MPLRPTTLPVVLLALGALIATAAPAVAQTYPDRPVKIIVPIGPSGSYDIVGRLLADQLSKRLGQSVVVENRPGAGTIVGTQAVINAPRWLYPARGRPEQHRVQCRALPKAAL
jgi:tripartite-type tricarboxylate transporter receptor subunit TctC